MKKINVIPLLFCFIIFAENTGCKKEPVQQVNSGSTGDTGGSGGTSNKSPIANAGTDITITLPLTRAALDGRNSSDPDNNITSYQWTKLSGPSSYSLPGPSAPWTAINLFTEGVYEF